MTRTKINTVFSLFLTDFFKKFGVLDMPKDDKLIQFLYDKLKSINTLLANDFMFYYDGITATEAKRSLKDLDRLHTLLSSTMNLFFSEFPEIKQTELNSEYKLLIRYFNDDHCMLSYATEKHKKHKSYTAEEAVNYLKTLVNV